MHRSSDRLLSLFSRAVRLSGLPLFLCVQLAPAATVAQDRPSEVCSVQTTSSGSLEHARNLFSSQCSLYPRTDCDPVPGGGWQCSSAVIGSAAPAVAELSGLTASSPVSVSPPVTLPPVTLRPRTVPPVTEPVIQPPAAVQPVSTSPVDSGNCYVRAATLQSAITSFTANCSTYQRKDCYPVDGAWICSNTDIPGPVQAAALDTQLSSIQSSPDGSAPASPDTSVPTLPVVVTPPAAVAPQTVPTVSARTPSAAIGRLGSDDLLVLHYDNCPDRDDGHAMPAGKYVVESLGISRVLVVNGTCGNSIRNRFNPASISVVRASWGSVWLDAHNQRASAVATSADRWAAELANGHDVWVAEGGQSDFSADVVRSIDSRYPGLNLKRINIIQHSAGSTAYNEMFTDSANLAFLKNLTSYQPIGNGNVGGNGTADLNMQSAYFVQMARGSRFSAEWNAGFTYLPPDCAVRTELCKLDFSDAVEVLYIVGDQRTGTVNDFANNYLRQ